MFLEREIKAWAQINADRIAWEDMGRVEDVNWIHHVLYVCEQWSVHVQDVMTIDVAKYIGAEVVDERCDKCRNYLIQKPGQDLRDCWECRCSKEQAQRGKTLMAKLRLKEAGVVVEPYHEPLPMPVPDDSERGFSDNGMPY